MSFEAMGWATAQRKYTGITKYVLVMISSYADSNTGEFFHRHKTIAADCGIGVSTVRKHLETFKSDGLVSSLSRFRDDGSQSSNVYRIDLDLLEDLAFEAREVRKKERKEIDLGVPPNSTPLSPDSRGDATTEQGGGADVATNKQSFNQSNINNKNIRSIFEFWQKTLNHPSAKLGAKREAAIRKALRLGYTVENLEAAVIGCSKTLHNMGYDQFTGIPTGKKYDDIELICRDETKIDRFISNHQNPSIDEQLQTLRPQGAAHAPHQQPVTQSAAAANSAAADDYAARLRAQLDSVQVGNDGHVEAIGQCHGALVHETVRTSGG